ncbi:NADH-quinone oxidoreductase subunit L [Scleromatobacter humisilvae]|uniref:NADH-quinone oxidoreductase subunit L n=1 Tax=Scleromatobacter humisilvae TaxID=2897159 RepID=A0A9X1YHF4_9BURK|nr:NADH-quinone oxidoreductase subunit L [Scleromatobacter humisilvae]MCK9685961.1 NADH-quinone oxidoreductase subunit L [Scleromatobacter humisilvae]
MSANISLTELVLVPVAPLVGAIVAGLFGKQIGRANAHRITILGVFISFVISAMTLNAVVNDGFHFSGTVYEWMNAGGLKMEVGFLIDGLTAMMMCVVTFVSLMVHIYTIGYMEEDPGYQRFFSYISLFTFSMLMLVMSNNFLQLFFGWEAVGLVSYLLIGFWFKKPSAVFANLKAFLVNRVGDFGFILGIGLIATYAHTLNYGEAFDAFTKAGGLASQAFGMGTDWMLITVTCICLFIGAMGKSAQFPLHVWLPDSMEGPTPISALIHAATMVTAGIFMVTRMSPLFELSDTALSVVLIIGSITALFMGFLGIIQNDIKRVVAYSTLSQLGYMTVALGLSAYPVAVFHLMTHAFFKALLFLAAGSTIMGMHHDQDIRNMGGLRKYMPITYWTSLIGSLALIGTPFFAGFYSKDSIIDAAYTSHLYGAGFAQFSVTAGVFVTAFYSFRMFFLVFHGEERFRNPPFPMAHAEPELELEEDDAHGHGAHDAHGQAPAHAAHAHDDHAHADHGHGHDDHGHAHEPHESPWVVTLPLVLLAIPSAVIGFMTIKPMLFGSFFGSSIFFNSEKHPAMEELAKEFHGPAEMALSAFAHPVVYLAILGVVLSYIMYIVKPSLAVSVGKNPLMAWIKRVLENKYYADWFNENVLAAGARLLGRGLWKGGDAGLIDGLFVNGSARLVGVIAGIVRLVQTGHLYWYALVMILGVFGLMTWQLWPYFQTIAH